MSGCEGAAHDQGKEPIRVSTGSEISDAWLARLDLETQRSEPAASVDLRIIGPRELALEGPRVLRRHRLRWPGQPALVLHDDAAPTSLVRTCFRAGAADVLPASASVEEIERVVADLIRSKRAGQAHVEEEKLLAAELGKHARELEHTLAQLRQSYDQTLNALVAALDIREKETAFHSQRVATYSVLVGLRLELDREALENLYRGALLHDIGKIGTPDAVLLKPGKFTEKEWEIMRQHAPVGGAILDQIGFLRLASEVPHAHHEAWDGSGYPRGLAGESIPRSARIFAVVDTYDAIRSKRPYKPAHPHARAIQLIQHASGQRLDPSIVVTFLAEPEETWAALEASLTGSITFESCLAACASILPPSPQARVKGEA